MNEHEVAAVSEQQWIQVCVRCRETFLPRMGLSEPPCEACPVRELDSHLFERISIPAPPQAA